MCSELFVRYRKNLSLLSVFVFAAVFSAFSQTTQVKLGQLDLTIGGLSATVTPAQPVIPKNVSSGVQIVATLNGQTLTASALAQYLGGPFQIQGEYSGPGLSQTVDVPPSTPSVNSLVLDLPAVTEAGNYTLSNLRFVVNGKDVFDLSPNSVVVDVIDQVLVTSVQTQALTLDQIQSMGVVLDSSDYTGFQFTVGLQLSSQVVNISFPVVFDSQGVAVPQPLQPPSTPTPPGVSVPVTVVPVLLQVGNGNGGGSGPPPTLPGGAPIRIPSVLVIPGNVGYLKQFFSAQLYVTNDTPAEANLVVDGISGTINLPPGPSGVVGGSDAPLALPNLTSGPEATTMPILLNGASTLNAGQTGQAQWTIVANSEGFYGVNFGINATLEGLPTGPVSLTGSASGGLLVRNPYFNMTFTVPGVVRSGELFNVYATVTNTSKAIANNLTVSIDAASLSGATLTSAPMPPIPTLNPGDSTTLTFQFKSLTTGKVVASYLHFDTQDGTTGQLNFTLGVYGNGTPMSPDTIVLPSSVDNLPSDVVGAAMRVLGQAWSVANAPPGTLPANVIPTTTAVVTQKALALSEAGLRQALGETLPNALRDLVPDFWGGSPVDPGFNQVLQTTPAGQNFIAVLGANLAQPMISAGGPLPYELQLDQLEASGPNFLAFAVGNGTAAAPVAVSLTDSSGNQLSTNVPGGSIPGGVLLALGSSSNAPVVGLVTAPTAPPYTLLLTPQASGFVDISIAIPRGDGTVIRGQMGQTVVLGQAMRVIADFSNPNNLVLQTDTFGDGSFSTSIPLSTQIISASGPNLTSATVIGPETVSQAGPFGLNMVLLFDRIVDATTSAVTGNYTIPNNSVQSASRQLSGRLVFGNLTQPEGPYVPTTAGVGGVQDQRGVVGPSSTVNLQSTLQDPGAVVSGRVLNADGSTSTSANVTYLNTPYSPTCQSGGGMQGLASTPVNGSGVYQFRYVHQDSCGGPFAVATTDPTNGALRQISSYVRAPGQQIVIDLAMLGLGSVSGQVLDLSGNPVPDAQVIAISGTDPQVGGQAFTDGNGNYTISGITVGPFTVKAGKGNSLGTSSGNIERAGTTAVVNITLNGGAVNVSGVVTQVLNGVTTPVPGLPVAYYQPYGGGRIAMGYVLTAVDGSYALTGMPTGSYTIEATLGSGLTADDTGVAVAGSNIVADLTIVIPTTAVVDGVVTYPNGSPAAGALVYQGQFGVLTAADGTFALGGVRVMPSQSQTIYARTVDGLRSGQTTVVVNASTPPTTGASISLSGIGTASFTVMDANGKPLANQQVKVADGGVGGCTDACGCNSQTTDVNGVVTFTGLGVGSVKGSALNSTGDFTSAIANITQDGITGYAVMQFHGSGTVTGSVVDPSNNPVLGATVQLSSNVFNPDYCSLQESYSQSIQTDVTGKFQFNSVLLGKVGVTASQAFYPTQVGAQGALTQNGGTVNFPLQMVNTISGVLSGVVFLPDGVTPAGAGVQVTANGPLPNVTVNTDATGTFKFAKIFPQGMYTLTAADPVSGGVTQLNVYLIANQNTTQNLRLLGTGTINVTVVDGAGVPVQTAYATLNENGYPNAVFNGSLNASNQGVISFPDVFEGNFSVSVVDPFGRAGRASGTLPQGTTSLNIQVQLTTTGTVQGHYYMPDGMTPIPNAIVNLVASGRTIGQATTLSSGDVGSFTFDYVPAGSVQLNAQDPLTGRTGIAASSIATQGQTLTLNVLAEGLDTIQGQVTSDGLPQPGASVSITSGSFQATTSADSNGNYLMAGVPEGVVVATASLSNGFLTGTASTSTRGDGNTFTLNVALRSSGTVTGQVVQADGVTPATASLVTITVGGTGGGTLSTTTDAAGNFSFNLVPAGIANLSVRELGSIDQGTGQVVVPPGSSIATKIALNGIGSLSGVALNSAGQPTPGTIILTGTGQFPYYLTVTAASNGTFSLPQVLAGPFTARLSANSGGFTLYGTASGTILPNQNATLNIEVQPSGTVSGVVLRPDGQMPAVGANVVIQLLSGGSITLQAQNDGSFDAVGVPLGNFTVQISDPVSGGLAAVLGLSISSNGQPVNLGTITLDGNALSVVNTNPTDGATGIGVNQALTVTFSEALSNTGGIYVANGTSNVYLGTTLSADGRTVTLQGTMPDGLPLVLNVTGQVTDVFGRQVLVPQTIHFTTADLTPPYVISIVPANQAIQVPVTTTVVATFNKALSATASLANVITVASVGGPAAGSASLSAPNAITFTPSAPLVDNTIYNVTVSGAVSFGGNVQTSPYSSSFVSPETATPVLQMSAPLNGSYINSATPTITISLSDQLTGINPATASLMLDGQTVAPRAGSTYITFTPSASLANGPHTVYASVQNNAGVVGILSASFIVDTTPPSVAILTGISAGQVLKGQIAVSGSATDTISGIAKINLLVDGVVQAALLPPNFSAAFNTVPLVDGPHNFAVQAVNNAGTAGPVSTAIQAFVENVPLSVAISSPLNGAPFRAQVVVTAVPSESVQKVTFALGTQTVTSTASPYQGTLSLSGVADGQQVITVTVFDFVGDTASSTVTIDVMQTPPGAPNANLIFAEPPSSGTSLVHGLPGSVSPGGLVITATDTVSHTTATATAAPDGSFAMNIVAAVNDTLSLTATDIVGNVSAPTLIAVRQTPSLPPASGNTSLTYQGDLVDRVGLAPGSLVPDGQADAVFTLGVSIGDNVTRTISYIDLQGGGLLRSTRAGSVPLGVAADVGAPLQNSPSGPISFPITTGATLTLFAGDNGFIVPGTTYTATAVFTDGSHFVGTYTYVAPADRQYVAHSATITANPATVQVNGSTPGTSTITITNIRDINGTVVPDGAKVALSAANGATVNPAGTSIPSAGGVFTDGTTAANNPNFQVYTIQNGTVTASYSSQPVVPGPVSGTLAVLQMQAADSNNNVLGTKAVSAQDINIRASTDSALVSVSPGSLYADRADHRSHITIVLRDSSGHVLPDGTRAAISVSSGGSIISCCWVQSAGGSLLGGAASPNGGNYVLGTMTGGTVSLDYSDQGVSEGTNQTSPAVVQILPVTGSGYISNWNAIGSATITLLGAAGADIDPAQPSVPQVSPAEPLPIKIQDVHDARGNLVPDGANIGISAAPSATIWGCCWVSSAGGTIADGTPVNGNASMHYFPLNSNGFVATYLTDGSTIAGPGQTATAVLQLAMVDPNGYSLSNYALTALNLTLVPPSNTVGYSQPASILGDGAAHTATVTFKPVIDAYGNVVPDGTKLAVSVNSSAAIWGCCWLQSAGGQILSGTPSPSTGYYVHTVQNGALTVTYADQNVTAATGQQLTANVVVLEANSSGAVANNTAVGVVPVTISGLSSAQGSASPIEVVANGGQHVSTVTFSNFRDAAGTPVPDGTQVAVTAIASGSIVGCCWVSSAGGVIIGGTTAPFGSGHYQLFPITNGQVVLQYSSQGVSGNSQQAIIQVIPVTPSGNAISYTAVATVSIEFPGSATVSVSPADLTANGLSNQSAVTISGLKDTDGITPVPDGALVGLTSVPYVTIYGCCWVGGAGGTISAAGTSPGDGTLATNNSNFQEYTVAGGQVLASYSDLGVTAGVGQTVQGYVAVVPLSSNGSVLTTTAIGLGAVNLHGVTSTTATGPATMSLSANSTRSVTFSGIKDSAGNMVPDGTAVAVTAGSYIALNGCCWVVSAGGTIVDGNPSPSGGNYKVFTTVNGSVTVTYSTAGASVGTATVQILPAKPNGSVINNVVLNGGVWPIAITN